MKTLGLIGGSTWVSTADYYRYINRITNEKTNGKDYARLILYSLNFSDLHPQPDVNNWQRISEMLCDYAKKLETAGAHCLLLCANTLHQYAEVVQSSINIPIIHIAEATSKEIINKNIHKVALLGTRYTMEKDFYKNILLKNNIEPIVPDETDREFIQHSIYNELAKEIFKEETKSRYIQIIDKLVKQRAEGVILGCTEIPLLIKQEDCSIPAFDTTLIHAIAAVEFALSD